MLREIVIIDEDKCDGCGLCVPACEEGALRIVNGKARLVSDRLCDGLGACLGHCPQGAIRVEKREVAAFDEQAVAAHRHASAPRPIAGGTPVPHRAPEGCPAARLATFDRPAASRNAGCPSSRLAQFDRDSGVSGTARAADGLGEAGRPSELRHWPVQLRLLPPSAPVLKRARLLIAADCVPVACADFHARMLRGHAVVIACPKLDDTAGYIEKLEAMIRFNDLQEITVAHMEVPCCLGILHAVLEARRRAGSDIPINDVVVSTRGEVIAERAIPAESVA